MADTRAHSGAQGHRTTEPLDPETLIAIAYKEGRSIQGSGAGAGAGAVAYKAR